MRDPINPPIISPDHFVWDLALSVSDEIINDSGRELYVELRSIGAPVLKSTFMPN